MDKNLSPKRILIGYTLRNRGRRIKKSWWSEELMQRWNEMCIEEKNWLRAQVRDKKEHRQVFLAKRKLFDRSVQKRNVNTGDSFKMNLLTAAKTILISGRKWVV